MTPASANAGPESVANPHRPVLVAVDFSDDSRAALLWACAFTECAGGRLYVVHVVHDPAAQPGYYRKDQERPLQPMERVAEGMLEAFILKLQHERPELSALKSVETKLVTGLPPGRIVEMADMLDAKLIVLGSRGMTGLPHLMQGSVSERVVELASGPVVVVKAPGGRGRRDKRRKRDDKAGTKPKKERSGQDRTTTEPAQPAPDAGRDQTRDGG